jgi:hypothetical protein
MPLRMHTGASPQALSLGMGRPHLACFQKALTPVCVQVGGLSISYPNPIPAVSSVGTFGSSSLSAKVIVIDDSTSSPPVVSAAGTAVDSAAAAAQAAFLAVAAADTTPPVITLLGAIQMQLLEGDNFEGARNKQCYLTFTNTPHPNTQLTSRLEGDSFQGAARHTGN